SEDRRRWPVAPNRERGVSIEPCGAAYQNPAGRDQTYVPGRFGGPDGDLAGTGVEQTASADAAQPGNAEDHSVACRGSYRLRRKARRPAHHRIAAVRIGAYS